MIFSLDKTYVLLLCMLDWFENLRAATNFFGLQTSAEKTLRIRFWNVWTWTRRSASQCGYVCRSQRRGRPLQALGEMSACSSGSTKSNTVGSVRAALFSQAEPRCVLAGQDERRGHSQNCWTKPKCLFILVAVYNDACDTVDVSCAVLAAVAELGVAFQKIIHKHVVASPTR